MDCCGDALTRRNWMWGTILTSVGAMLAGGVGTAWFDRRRARRP